MLYSCKTAILKEARPSVGFVDFTINFVFWQVKNDSMELTIVRGHVDGSEYAKGVTSSSTSQGATHSNGPAPFCKSVQID